MKTKELIWIWAADLLAALGANTCAPNAVLVSDPYNLPPPGGPGSSSAPGQAVSFYAQYGTSVGMPPDHTLTGILIRAHGSLWPCRVPMTNGPQRFFRVRQP